MLRVDGDYVAAIAEYDRGLAELAVEEGDDDEGDDEQGEGGEESGVGAVIAGCSRTRSGLNCDEWGENEFGLPADSTECARVDGLKRPWCYTDGEDWEYCDCGASGKPDLVLFPLRKVVSGVTTGAVGDGAASGIVGRIAAMEAQLLMARGASRAKLPADSDAAAAGHVEQALADFDASLGLQEQAPTYNAMGNVLKAARRGEEAMQAYESALELDPEFAVAHFNLGALRHAQG